VRVIRNRALDRVHKGVPVPRSRRVVLPDIVTPKNSLPRSASLYCVNVLRTRFDTSRYVPQIARFASDRIRVTTRVIEAMPKSSPKYATTTATKKL
jgi:hypothetical protein